MKKTIPYIILVFLLLFSFEPKAQSSHFGITGNIGMSQIGYSAINFGLDKSDNGPLLSGNGGFCFFRDINDKWAAGAELLYVQIEGRGQVSFDQPLIGGVGGVPVGASSIVVTTKVKNHLGYVALPLFVRYQIGRAAIKLGFQSMFLSSSSYHFWEGAVFEDSRAMKHYGGNIEGVNFFDIGGKLGYEFKLLNSLWIRADVYLGLSDISETSRKNRQYTLGLNYYLTK